MPVRNPLERSIVAMIGALAVGATLLFSLVVLVLFILGVLLKAVF